MHPSWKKKSADSQRINDAKQKKYYWKNKKLELKTEEKKMTQYELKKRITS